MKRLDAAIVLVFLALPLPAGAQESSEWPAERRLRVLVDSHLEFHNFLNVAAISTVDKPEYLSQVNLYRQARELIVDPLAWRFINDSIVEGPDMETIISRVNEIPASLGPADVEGVRKIFQALGDGWPRYSAHDAEERNSALQRFVSRTLRRRFMNTVETLYMKEVYETYRFSSIDAPITLMPVIQVAELGDWGRSSRGYYVVLPSVSRSSAHAMDEDIVHEVTHVLDIAQPTGTRSILKKIREAGSRVDPLEMQLFMHGLVVWTTGEIVREVLPTPYEPGHSILKIQKEQIAPYRGIYEGPWRGYLDGQLDLDRAIQGMISGLKPKTP